MQITVVYTLVVCYMRNIGEAGGQSVQSCEADDDTCVGIAGYTDTDHSSSEDDPTGD